MRPHIRRFLACLALAVTASLPLAAVGVQPAVAMTYSEPQSVPGAPSNPSEGVEYRGLLYMNGTDELSRARLYSFDGASFSLVDDTYYGVENLRVINDELYYTARDGIGWYIFRYDGVSNESVATLTSTYGPLDVVGLGDTLVVTIPQSSSQTDVVAVTSGGTSLIGSYESVLYLTVFENYVFYTASPLGTTDPNIYRTDGVTTSIAQPGGAVETTVWAGNMYFAFVDQTYSFYRMQPDVTLEPASSPLIEYAFGYTDGGDVLYFSGERDDVSSVFAYDGVTTTTLPPLPYLPETVGIPGDRIMYDGHLWIASLPDGLFVCGGVSIECHELAIIFFWDGTDWVRVLSPANDNPSFIVFQGRLYFQNGANWSFIEPLSELPNTGNGSLNLAVTAALSVLLAGAGWALVVRRRRRG